MAVSTAALTAIVLADVPGPEVRVVGLTLAERARRVAEKAGASAVFVARDRASIAAWWRDQASSRVLVIRATDQLVHTPLVAGLLDHERAIAVDPDSGAYAGALIARDALADRVVAALVRGDDDGAVAAALVDSGAREIAHGELARHAATTRRERRAAAQMLYRIIHKPQDNAITRYLYRPLSFPLTRLLVHTSITPNQITFVTALLVALGCCLVGSGDVVAGTAIVLAASYVDCCDGEVARLRLETSRLGAWLDTIVDELSQVAYLLALGLAVDAPHKLIAIGVFTYALSIYCIYWNLVVLVGSANSQDYVGKFEIRGGALRPIAATGEVHPFMRYLGYVIRRDFVCWAMLVLVALHGQTLGFGLLVLGGIVTATIVTSDHVRVRGQLEALRGNSRR